jgi:hypothetical protein
MGQETTSVLDIYIYADIIKMAHRQMRFFHVKFKFLRHVKDPLRYNRYTERQKSVASSHSVSHHFATRCVCCNHSRELWWMNWE